MKKNLIATLLFITLFISQLEGKILIGIAGGTGSGKTTLAEKIVDYFEGDAVLISQDCYYKDFSKLSVEERSNLNFDHPDSLDFALLHTHLLELKQNKPILKPLYDFVTHSRLDCGEIVNPNRIVVVEGILLFAEPSIRDLFDLKIFIDTDDDIRILRRLARDIHERGRDLESVQRQYIKTVKPMHKKFVKPSKDFADVVVHGINENVPVVTKLIASYLENESNL